MNTIEVLRNRVSLSVELSGILNITEGFQVFVASLVLSSHRLESTHIALHMDSQNLCQRHVQNYSQIRSQNT